MVGQLILVIILNSNCLFSAARLTRNVIKKSFFIRVNELYPMELVHRVSVTNLPYLFSLGSISKDFTKVGMKEVASDGLAYDFSIDVREY